jgi:hypothetical protein
MMTATEFELLGELEDELEEEAAELEVLSTPRGPNPRKCDARGIPAREPRRALGRAACTQQSAHGVADPISVLRKARERALDMLDLTIDKLLNARKAVCDGATSAPLDNITRCWLRNGLGVNTDDIRVWTAGTFEPIRSIAEVVRRLVRVRNLIGGSDLRYSCTGRLCNPNPDWWAYTTPYDEYGECLPGTPLMLIRLCRPFWIPGLRPDRTPIPTEVHAEFQAQTIIHEASHITHCTGDLRGHTIGAAECLAQFVAATNDSWLDPRFVDLCVGTERCRQPLGGAKVFQLESSGPGFARRASKRMRIVGTIFRPQNSIRLKGRRAVVGKYEIAPSSYNEEELEDDYFEEPYRWPKWPASRTFNPPLQTIPAGPYKTFSCEAMIDDFTKLSLAVGDLKNQLRQSPSNSARVQNRADVVTSLSRQVVARLKQYVKQGCTRQDMKLFASSVNTMRGGGTDSDIGSWPPASSSGMQGPRKQARKSLRLLLDWIRRAE